MNKLKRLSGSGTPSQRSGDTCGGFVRPGGARIETSVARRTASVHRPSRGAARVVALTAGSMAVVALAVVAARSIGQGSPQLVRFNGFESGGAGDYAISAGTPLGSLTHRGDAAGRFGLQTAADGGANEYVQFALADPVTSFTDGIWACVDTAPQMGVRRVRSWL